MNYATSFIPLLWTPSQNTTSRMHLKNGRRAGSGAYARKGTTSSVMVASMPEVSFEQIAAPVPEIMDGSLYVYDSAFHISYS
jgi:hypothetical protein